MRNTVMVKEGDPCPECGKGTMSFRGYRAYEGQKGDESLYQGIGQETGFVCDLCGAKWNAVSKTFTHKYNLETRTPKQQGTNRRADRKGGMKKMKNTAKPRRQSPR